MKHSLKRSIIYRISLILVIALLIAKAQAQLLAAASPTAPFSNDLLGALDSTLQVGGQDTLIVSWSITAIDNTMTLRSVQSFNFAYDNTVLQLTQYDDGTPIADSSLGTMGTNFPNINGAGYPGAYNYNLRLFGAKSPDLTTGYVQFELGDSVATCTCPPGVAVTLESARFAFRSGKTPADLQPGSVRLLAANELHSLAQVQGILLATNEGGNTQYYFNRQSGGGFIGENTLEIPDLTYPGSDNPSQAALAGSVSISGTAKFGETLTAITTALTTDPAFDPPLELGELTYQWKRGAADIGISGAAATYELTEADIGQVITVAVTAAYCTGSVTSAATSTVAKADGPAAPPALDYSVSSGGFPKVVTIAPVTGAEYSFDGGATYGESNTYISNTAELVAIAIRIKETATHNASPASNGEANTANESQATPPPFALLYAAVGETSYTVTIPETAGAEYSFDGTTWQSGNTKAGCLPGETVTGYKRMAEKPGYNASGAVSDSVMLPLFQVKTPTISPDGGTFTADQQVTITTATAAASIYYTTDGSAPDASGAAGASSILYAGPFTLSATATVKAIAIKDGMLDSEVSTAAFTINKGGVVPGGEALVSITGPASVASGAGATATYTISAKNMPPVSAIELEFEVDGAYLSSNHFIGLGGFTLMNAGNYGTPIYWKNNGDIWTGKATLLNLTGAGGGAPVSGDSDILSLVFNVAEGVLGNAEIKLNYIKMSYAGFIVDLIIVDGSVSTDFVKAFSPYDLNKDGVIDLHDLTWALQYLLVQEGDPNWDIAKAADFTENGRIEIDDLILILANYTVPYYT